MAVFFYGRDASSVEQRLVPDPATGALFTRGEPLVPIPRQSSVPQRWLERLLGRPASRHRRVADTQSRCGVQHQRLERRTAAHYHQVGFKLSLEK